MTYLTIKSNAQSVATSSTDVQVKRLANLVAELTKKVTADLANIEAYIRRVESNIK